MMYLRSIRSPKAVFNLEKAGIEEVITDFIETVLMVNIVAPIK